MSHVLIVDHGTGYLRRLSEDLIQAGIEVLTADCALSALECARAEGPDLILSMENLPEFDVLDLLELKQEDKKLAETPLVVVSTSSRRKFDCYKLGCDDFIELPADEPEIIFRVCAVLRRAVRAALSGRFEEVSFADVVQLLAAAQRNGRLMVDVPSGNGELILRNGQVVHAQIKEASGEGAFLQLFRASQSGSFVFLAEPVEGIPASINKRTDHLLLHFANTLDEEKSQ